MPDANNLTPIVTALVMFTLIEHVPPLFFSFLFLKIRLCHVWLDPPFSFACIVQVTQGIHVQPIGGDAKVVTI